MVFGNKLNYGQKNTGKGYVDFSDLTMAELTALWCWAYQDLTEADLLALTEIRRQVLLKPEHWDDDTVIQRTDEEVEKLLAPELDQTCRSIIAMAEGNPKPEELALKSAQLKLRKME